MSADTNPSHLVTPLSTLSSLVSKFDPVLATVSKYDNDDNNNNDSTGTTTTNNNTPSSTVQTDFRDLQSSTSSDFATKRQNFESFTSVPSHPPLSTTAFTHLALNDATPNTTTSAHSLSKSLTGSSFTLEYSRTTSASTSVSTSVASSPSLPPLPFVASQGPAILVSSNHTSSSSSSTQQVTPSRNNDIQQDFPSLDCASTTAASTSKGLLLQSSNINSTIATATALLTPTNTFLKPVVPVSNTTTPLPLLTKMSTSPTATSPMTTPSLTQGSSLFNISNNNNGNVLRSPSMNSGKGNHIGGSASSATTANSSTLTANGSGTTMASSVATGGSGLGSSLPSSGVSDVKLKRFLEHNQRLQEQLEMRRISVSEASQSLIKFVMGTKDLLIPTLWGNPPSDPFSKQATGCCTIS